MVAGVLPVGQVNAAAVGEVFVKMLVDPAQCVGVTRHIDESGFRLGKCLDRVVGDDLIVKAKTFGEFGVTGAGKTNDF